MESILSCPGPEDHTDPDSDLDALGTYDVIFETDDLLEALARTSGMYGVSPNGHGKPRAETTTEPATAADGGNGRPPAPPDNPSDGDHPSDDHSGGGAVPRRCEHGHLMLCTDDLIGWAPPEPGVDYPIWWCPTWCNRLDTDPSGNEIDPTEWVHRTQPFRITPKATGATTGVDGAQITGPVTITVQAEKHPAREVRFTLAIAVDGTEHTVTLTVEEARRLYGFCNDVVGGLTGHHLAA